MANESLAMQAINAPFRVAAAGGRMWWAGVRGVFNLGLDGARMAGDFLTRTGRAGRESAEKAATEVRSRAEEVGERLEEVGERLEEQVESALHRLGVPTREDLSELGRRIDDLAARLRVPAVSRTTYHLTPSDGQWQVKREGAEDAEGVYDTKDEALSAGRELAHGHEPSQLVVHRLDGTIQTSYSYGETT